MDFGARVQTGRVDVGLAAEKHILLFNVPLIRRVVFDHDPALHADDRVRYVHAAAGLLRRVFFDIRAHQRQLSPQVRIDPAGLHVCVVSLHVAFVQYHLTGALRADAAAAAVGGIVQKIGSVEADQDSLGDRQICAAAVAADV